jgi:hypothetical protein
MWTANNVKNIGMVVTLDVGEASLHPKLKRPIGQRLAKLAGATVYGQHVEYASPLYKAPRSKERRSSFNLIMWAKG